MPLSSYEREALRLVQEEREAKIQASLANKPDPLREFAEAFGQSPFADIHKRVRKIGNRPDTWPVLHRLLTHRERWVAPLEEWVPRGKTIETVLRSLVTHLICQYPMPSFWYEVWFRSGHADNRFEDFVNVARAVDNFVRIAQGEGLYRLVQEGAFSVPFTKRQCHAFMRQRNANTVPRAIRWTQVEHFDGTRRLAEVLCGTTWGEDVECPRVTEDFRAGAVQWFCQQGMLDPVQVGPLIDYVEHCRGDVREWSFKGRTGRSLMRDMEEWHKELAALDRVANRQNLAAQRAMWAERRSPPPEKFEPSGIRNWETSRKTKDNRTGKQLQVRYAITELLTYQALHDEGRQLHHCAASYAWSVGKGQKSIWSFSIGREKQVTIEVRNPTKTVVQIRGTRNRMPTASEITYIQKWASENGLILTNRAVARGW